MVDAQPLLWTGTGENNLLGALGEGLYVTQDNATPTCTVTLWEVGNPPTALDTATFGSVTTHENVVSNDSGLVGMAYRDSGFTRHLVIPTQSGGALSLAVHTMPASAVTLYRACHDGSGFLYFGGGSATAIDTSGSTSWSVACTDLFALAYPSANRFISLAFGPVIHLRSSAGASLDTDTDYVSPSQWLGTGTDLTTWLAYNTGTELMEYRTLDTSGDTLAWTSAVVTFDPNWGTTIGGYPMEEGRFSCWNGQVACVAGAYPP